MKKRIAALLFASVLLLSTCNNSDDQALKVDGTGTEATTVDLEKTYNSMVSAAADGTPEMSIMDEDMMLNLCGIKSEDISTAFVSVCSDSLRADEIWVIEAKDKAALDRITELANKRITAKDEESITYSPEQNKIVKNGQIIIKGNYFALIVSPDVDAMAKIFKNAVGA